METREGPGAYLKEVGVVAAAAEGGGESGGEMRDWWRGIRFRGTGEFDSLDLLFELPVIYEGVFPFWNQLGFQFL